MATPDVLQTTSTKSDDFTICGLCQETFTRPKVLSCLHTFCYECLNRYICDSNGASNQNMFLCPSCDLEIELPVLVVDGLYADNLRDDQFMTTLVELKKALKDDKSCDVCLRNDETVLAENWCSDCNDTLCESCFKVHLHVKVTASHSVVPLIEMRKMPLETIMRKKSKVNCDKHGESITLFCVDCKDPLCVQCMAVSHRRCENVITASDAVTSETDIDNIMATLKTLQLSLDSVDGLGVLEKHLEASIDTSKQEIMYLSNSLCAKIRDQEHFLLKQLEHKAADAKKILRERTEPRKAQVKTAKSASQRLGNLLKYGSDVEVLMAFNQVKKQIDDYNMQIGDTNPDKLKVKVEFIPEEASLTYLDELKSLGELKVDTGADDGISSWGVTCTSQEDIIVTDCKNKRIQKFSRQGELADHIQLDDEPRDITTCGNGTDVAVPLIGRLIIFIATRKSLELIRKTKTERQYDGISYSNTESYLVVTCMRERVVDIIQLDGEVLKSFQNDGSGEFLFDRPRYIASSVGGTIVVSDIGIHAVKCIDRNGYSLYTYTGHNDLKCPQGICVDKIGNIFVADNSNDRVQLLTSHGAFQRFVLAKESGLERPCAIMISGSNRLIIVQNDGMVKVYSYC